MKPTGATTESHPYDRAADTENMIISLTNTFAEKFNIVLLTNTSKSAGQAFPHSEERSDEESLNLFEKPDIRQRFFATLRMT